MTGGYPLIHRIRYEIVVSGTSHQKVFEDVVEGAIVQVAWLPGTFTATAQVDLNLVLEGSDVVRIFRDATGMNAQSFYHPRQAATSATDGTPLVTAGDEQREWNYISRRDQLRLDIANAANLDDATIYIWIAKGN